MKRFLLAVLLVVIPLLAAGREALSLVSSAPQIRTGTSQGAIGIKIALPEFQAAAGDTNAAALTEIFNKVLWDDLDYSGGVISDWGAHLFDTAQWANNTERSGPVEIEGTGTFWSGGLYNTIKDYDVTFRYANGVVMTCKPDRKSVV